MRIRSFDYFRGIAIFFIVAGHSMPNSNWQPSTFLEKLFQLVIYDNSFLFVFISGFFYHYIFHGQISYRKFLLKKFKNLLVPYIVLSSFAFVYFVLIKHDYTRLDMSSEPTEVLMWVYSITKYYTTGQAFTPYWYIPFVFTIFIASPLINAFISMSTKKQALTFSLFYTLSFILGRPGHDILGSALYFMPFYLMGIIFSINRECFLCKLVEYRFPLVMMYLLIISGQVLYGEKLQELNFIIINKLLFVSVIVSLLTPLEKTRIPALQYVAHTSFAIYLIHPWAFLVIHKVLENWFDGSFVHFLIFFVLAIGISLGVAYFSKLMLRRNSKWITGY